MIDYRARALALYRLGRRKYSAEKAWEKNHEEMTRYLWAELDGMGIPRKLDDIPNGYNSLMGRLELAAERLSEAERLLKRVIQWDGTNAHVNKCAHCGVGPPFEHKFFCPLIEVQDFLNVQLVRRKEEM